MSMPSCSRWNTSIFNGPMGSRKRVTPFGPTTELPTQGCPLQAPFWDLHRIRFPSSPTRVAFSIINFWCLTNWNWIFLSGWIGLHSHTHPCLSHGHAVEMNSSFINWGRQRHDFHSIMSTAISRAFDPIISVMAPSSSSEWLWLLLSLAPLLHGDVIQR